MESMNIGKMTYLGRDEGGQSPAGDVAHFCESGVQLAMPNPKIYASAEFCTDMYLECCDNSRLDDGGERLREKVKFYPTSRNVSAKKAIRWPLATFM